MDEIVRILKTASVLFVLMISASWYSTVVAPPAEDSMIGVRQGAWAKYFGSPPTEEYEWISISVLQINASVVDLEMRYDLRMRFRLYSSYYFPDHPGYVSVNVGDGTNNFFMFLIPRNLSVGDTVPIWRGHVPLRIEGVEQRVYAGAKRAVLYASFSNMTVDYANFTVAGRYYWDKETGLLVERIATVGNEDMTTEILKDTNIWSTEVQYWIAGNLPAIIIFGLVIGAMIISTIVILRWRKISDRVSHRNFGGGLFTVGVVLVVATIIYLTSYEQSVSLFCFALAPFFLVSGVFAYTGAWVTLRRDQLVADIGILMMAAALILSGIVIPCFVYRELAAIVPYTDDIMPAGTGGSIIGHTPSAYTSLEGVFLYPYAWLASALMNVIICLAAAGFFYKIAQRF
jgi:hypothetical protein